MFYPQEKFFVSGFYESPGLKIKGLNPGDSANPAQKPFRDTTIKSLACGTGAFGATAGARAGFAFSAQIQL
jgi:hypothetical protein